jgi:hypothetical protein
MNQTIPEDELVTERLAIPQGRGFITPDGQFWVRVKDTNLCRPVRKPAEVWVMFWFGRAVDEVMKS